MSMGTFSAGDPLNAIVCDIGEYATKIGFAGEDYPRSYFRSNIAALREGDDPVAKKKSDKATTTNTGKRRPIQELKYDFFNRPVICRSENPEDWHDGNWQPSNPVDATTGLWYDPADSGPGNQGADWYDQFQIMIKHGFKSALGGAVPENHPFLLVERSYNPPPIRQQIIECLFEEFKMPAVFLAKDATLACYACGRTTGTVVDMGYGGTTVTPVYEGYVEQKGIRRSPIGTLEMDERILKTLDHFTTNKKPFMPLYQVRRTPHHTKRAEPFHRLARLDIAQQCREEGVGAAVDTTSTAVAFAARQASYKLPDGQEVNLSSAHRFAVTNLILGKDEESASAREELCEARKQKLSSYITATTDLKEEEDDGTGEEKPSAFTEAAALGISAPATRRGRATRRAASAAAAAAAAKAAEESKKKARKMFPNRVLQKACVPYLQTHLEQLSSAPLGAMVCDTAFQCDRDQQPQLLGNVILAGGGACLGPTEQAVPDYLRFEVESIIHQHTPGWRVKVLAPGLQERKICSWLGGSILGSLGTFHEMWITREEYEEYGTAIVNRKCP